MASTTVAYLIPSLRRQIGDYTEPYTNTDLNLTGFLLDSIKALGGRWNNRYVVGSDDSVTRSLAANTFVVAEPPVIQNQDERPIILQASVTIKSGSNWSGSSSVVTWKDDEVYFSNTEGQKFKVSSFKEDLEELNNLFPRKLARPKYGRLTGYRPDWQ